MSFTGLPTNRAPVLGSTPPLLEKQSHHSQQHLAQRSGPFFSYRSHDELASIARLVKRIKKPLTSSVDSCEGVVYVLQAKEIDFVKVGYTKKEDLSRVETIMKDCGVHIVRMFDTQSFRGAYRAEQILHHLLAQWGYNRLQCTCGSVNREWFQRPFSLAVGDVQMVFNWFNNQKPYDMKSRKLRPIWERALTRWHESQQTERPSEWIDFFLLNENYITGRRLFASPRSKSSSSSSKSTTPRSSSVRGGVHQLFCDDGWLQTHTTVSDGKTRCREIDRTPTKKAQLATPRRVLTTPEGDQDTLETEEDSCSSDSNTLSSQEDSVSSDEDQGLAPPSSSLNRSFQALTLEESDVRGRTRSHDAASLARNRGFSGGPFGCHSTYGTAFGFGGLGGFGGFGGSADNASKSAVSLFGEHRDPHSKGVRAGFGGFEDPFPTTDKQLSWVTSPLSKQRRRVSLAVPGPAKSDTSKHRRRVSVD